MSTRAGYSRTVRLWRRGANVDQAPVLFDTEPERMVAAAWLDRTQAQETVWFVDKPGFFEERIWIGDRTGPKAKLDLPTDIETDAHRGWLA